MSATEGRKAASQQGGRGAGGSAGGGPRQRVKAGCRTMTVHQNCLFEDEPCPVLAAGSLIRRDFVELVSQVKASIK